MKKIVSLLIFILTLSLVSAHHVEHNEIDYNKVKQLIDSNISCDKLTNEQLEEIGEYYMEQMHPGSMHDMMADMLGLHKSDKIHDDFHINLAKALYCGNTKYMPIMMSQNIVAGRMNMMDGLCGLGMGGFGMVAGTITWIAVIIILILLMVWLYKQIKKK